MSLPCLNFFTDFHYIKLKPLTMVYASAWAAVKYAIDYMAYTTEVYFLILLKARGSKIEVLQGLASGESWLPGWSPSCKVSSLVSFLLRTLIL